MIEKHLRREGSVLELRHAACREHGMADVSSVELAVLEIDGSTSIDPTIEHTLRIRREVKTIGRG